jgi:hypothetical protein
VDIITCLVIAGIIVGAILGVWATYLYFAEKYAVISLPDKINNLDKKFDRLIDVLNTTRT